MAVTFKGRDIFQYRVPLSGIAYHSPETEWVLAAHFDHISYSEFREKPVEYQEKIIAARRVFAQEQAVLAWANRPKNKPIKKR